MHGKWGGPQGLAVFANKLEAACHVVLLEMPWSGRRAYDQPYTVALKEISAQVQTLRGKGYRQVPVLWVIGTQDPLYPAGEAYADAKLPAHAKSRYLVVDAGHGNTPEVAATGVIEWLKGLE
jgi:pimeloyl-ACP methyl ester carboxylesterase